MVTSCAAQPGTSWLVRGANPLLLIAAMRWQRDRGRIRLLGYCIMPDHLHWLLCLVEGVSLSHVVRSLKAYTGRRAAGAPRHGGRVWQEGFYDHLLPSRREYQARLAYVHDNPVRAGLVESAEEWPYSTANPTLADDIDREWLP